MDDAMAVGVDGTCQNLGGAPLVGTDLDDMVGPQVANQRVERGLRRMVQQRARIRGGPKENFRCAGENSRFGDRRNRIRKFLKVNVRIGNIDNRIDVKSTIDRRWIGWRFLVHRLMAGSSLRAPLYMRID